MCCDTLNCLMSPLPQSQNIHVPLHCTALISVAKIRINMDVPMPECSGHGRTVETRTFILAHAAYNLLDTVVYYEYIGMLNDVRLSQYEAALLLHLVAIDRIVWAWKQIRASFCVLTPPLERWSFGIYMSRVLSHRHTRKRLTSKRAHTHTQTQLEMQRLRSSKKDVKDRQPKIIMMPHASSGSAVPFIKWT